MLVQTQNKLQEMLELSREYDQNKHDYTVPVCELKFNDRALLEVPVTTNLFETSASAILAPTEHAWNQIFSKAGYMVFGKGSNKKLPADYLLNIPKDLLAQSMNRHLQNANTDSWLVRGYVDNARAILSDKYAIIQNTEMLDLICQVVDRQNVPDFKLVRPYVDPDTLHAKMVWRETNRPDGRGGNYGIGVYVKNGEIGNSSVAVYPLIQRSSCTNSIIFDEAAGVKFHHSGNVTSKRVQMQSMMIEIFPQAAEFLEKMIAAQEDEIPAFNDVLKGLAEHYGWDDKTSMAIATGTEASQTRAGIVNGVSYAAHVLHENDPDAMTGMETLAGRILVAPGTLFDRARKMARAEI